MKQELYKERRIKEKEFAMIEKAFVALDELLDNYDFEIDDECHDECIYQAHGRLFMHINDCKSELIRLNKQLIEEL